MLPLNRYLHLHLLVARPSVNLQGTDSEDETSQSEDSGRKNPWRNLATGGDAYDIGQLGYVQSYVAWIIMNHDGWWREWWWRRQRRWATLGV